jgi:hypothetical protein
MERINCTKQLPHYIILIYIYIHQWLWLQCRAVQLQLQALIYKQVAIFILLQMFYLPHMRTLSTEYKAAAQMGLLSRSGL